MAVIKYREEDLYKDLRSDIKEDELEFIDVDSEDEEPRTFNSISNDFTLKSDISVHSIWETKKEKRPANRSLFLNPMVGAAGFELATPCTPCKCATRLRYAPT